MQAQATVNETVTEVQSLALIKNVLRVSISTICYLRALFPEDAYSIRDYAEMKVQQLNPAKDKDVALLSKWLEEGVFDALSKRYLKTFAFTLGKDLNGANEKVYEVYQWQFDYPDSKAFDLNGQRVCNNKQDLKQQTIALIRSLMQFGETLDNLPDERWISARLTYHDDITPVNYEPAFFMTCDPSVVEASTSGKTGLKIKLGGIKTPHLQLDMKFFAPLAEDFLPVQPASKGVCNMSVSKGAAAEEEEDDDDATVCSDETDATLTARNGVSALRIGIVSKDSSYDGQHQEQDEEDDDNLVIVESTSLSHLDKVRSYVLSSKKSHIDIVSKALNISPTHVLACFKRLASPQDGKPILAEYSVVVGGQDKVGYKLITNDNDETGSVASTVMEIDDDPQHDNNNNNKSHEQLKSISPQKNKKVRRKRLHDDLVKKGFDVSLSQEPSKERSKCSTIAQPIIHKKARTSTRE